MVNSGLPAGGRCGVASRVALGDGTYAIWLGVFAGQQPMSGAAVIPLVAGDHSDDQPPSRGDAFSPIKLTNSGHLLLKLTLDVSGRTVAGPLLLDHAFDWFGSFTGNGQLPGRVRGCTRPPT